ncbi:hypothetical protein D9M68_946470 [compost metagenome]
MFDVEHVLHDLMQAGAQSAGEVDAEFEQRAAQLVDQHGAHLHSQLSHRVQTEHALLRLGLGRHDRHAGLLRRDPDGLGVGGISLVGLHKRTHVVGVQQHRLVAEIA